MSNNYDAIIIGSGIGGLGCGAFLAKEGMRVLVLEKHFQIGGYAHSFRRESFRFESAVHSVPMSDEGFVFYLLRLLGIEKRVQTIEHPSMYRIISPGQNFSMPLKLSDIISKLSDEFPAERDSIKRMFDDMANFHEVLIKPLFSFEDKYTEKNQGFISKYFNRSYKSYIDEFISDAKLSNIFYSQWPFFGSSPDYAPIIFPLMAFYVHSLEGSHYLKNGFASLAYALSSVITDRGGEVRTSSRVSRLLAENGAAKAVRLDSGEEFDAGIVVSDITPYLLHSEIIEEKSRNKIWQRRINGLKPSVSALALYIGLKNDISHLIDDITLWYDNNDHDGIFRKICNMEKYAIEHLVFCMTPDASDKKTLLIMTYLNQACSDDWKRDKFVWAEKMLEKAELVLPGIKDNIECMEIGSPDTFERYTSNTNGALLGFENTKSLYGEAKLPVKTHLKNLYQTGHWCKPGGGVWNVMESAYTTSKIILLDQ